jgi:hypothetical protein
MVYVDSNFNLAIELTLYGLLPRASFLDIAFIKLSCMATFVAFSTVCERLSIIDTAEYISSFLEPWFTVNDDQQDVSDDDYNLEVVVYQDSVFSKHANLQFAMNLLWLLIQILLKAILL